MKSRVVARHVESTLVTDSASSSQLRRVSLRREVVMVLRARTSIRTGGGGAGGGGGVPACVQGTNCPCATKGSV
jgi:hypothetical protein